MAYEFLNTMAPEMSEDHISLFASNQTNIETLSPNNETWVKMKLLDFDN